MVATCTVVGTEFAAVPIRVEEDQCHDNEQAHVPLTVGVFLLRQVQLVGI